MKHCISAKSLLISILLVLLWAGTTGCAGTRSHIVVGEAPCPVSLSPALRTSQGEVRGERYLEFVGTFHHKHTSAHMLWAIIPLSRTKHDLSAELRQQVDKAGGDAVVNLKVKSYYNFWNTCWTMLSAGIIPTWSKVEVTGDIVRILDQPRYVPEEDEFEFEGEEEDGEPDAEGDEAASPGETDEFPDFTDDEDEFEFED